MSRCACGGLNIQRAISNDEPTSPAAGLSPARPHANRLHAQTAPTHAGPAQPALHSRHLRLLRPLVRALRILPPLRAVRHAQPRPAGRPAHARHREPQILGDPRLLLARRQTRAETQAWHGKKTRRRHSDDRSRRRTREAPRPPRAHARPARDERRAHLLTHGRRMVQQRAAPPAPARAQPRAPRGKRPHQRRLRQG